MIETYKIGVDEVGRGPIAGPVCIGICIVPKKDEQKLLAGIRDSKKLTAKKREEWYHKMIGWEDNNKMFLFFESVSSTLVDKLGIEKTLRIAIERGLKKFPQAKKQKILLDGRLKAPIEYKQESIIRGDDKELCISAASVYAKVLRDNLMIKYSDTYPQYYLSKNKGYGTKEHFKAIEKNGICELHRKSFLKHINF